VLTKPFRLEELLRVIGEVSRAPQGASHRE